MGTNLILHCVSELHYGVSFQYIIMRQIRELMSFINVTKACINLATLKRTEELIAFCGVKLIILTHDALRLKLKLMLSSENMLRETGDCPLSSSSPGLTLQVVQEPLFPS